MFRNIKRATLLLPLNILAPFFVAVCLLNACGGAKSANRADSTNSESNRTDAPIAVTTARTEKRQIPAFLQVTGSLVADETSNVAPKVAGKIADISVNIGDFVKAGAVIAKIDDNDARRRLLSAEAGVKQAQAAVRQAEARLGLVSNATFNASAIPEVKAAAANYEQALAELKQAKANEARYRDLVESGDVALITYEQYRTARETAEARAKAAKEQLDAQVNAAKQNNQAIASAQAALESAKTQVDIARQELADTVVRAPFSGFVSSRPVAVGEYVSSANVVATILRTNPLKLQMQIAESDVPFVKVGRNVSLTVDAYKDRRFSGSVTAINPAIDAASRSAVVEASIENPDNALRAGMFATARIAKDGGGEAVFVPRSAVYYDQATGGYRAFVIVEGVAKLRVLQLGQEEGDFYQVLSGLNADEIVATSNLPQLFEGAKVVV
jgi:multidrug efflux pump subunit AcrA (membrane-fusion protein)